MRPITPPDDISPSDYVSLILRQLALQFDPKLGRLSYLADEFDLHVSTLQMWITNGRIPPKPCRRLLKRFGKKWIDVSRLTGDA